MSRPADGSRVQSVCVAICASRRWSVHALDACASLMSSHLTRCGVLWWHRFTRARVNLREWMSACVFTDACVYVCVCVHAIIEPDSRDKRWYTRRSRVARLAAGAIVSESVQAGRNSGADFISYIPGARGAIKSICPFLFRMRLCCCWMVVVAVNCAKKPCACTCVLYIFATHDCGDIIFICSLLWTLHMLSHARE